MNAAERAEAERRQQGLPAKVVQPGQLAKVVALLMAVQR